MTIPDAVHHLLEALQLCRPLSGAVRCVGQFVRAFSTGLQLCRPLSGAVRALAAAIRPNPAARFNCAAPFRERLVLRFRRRGPAVRPFNCAAPFRERLAEFCPDRRLIHARLQLCRPLSGAVSSISHSLTWQALPALQLCRPLSGAVRVPLYRIAPDGAGAFNCAAPFRERLAGQSAHRCPGIAAFNCAAPFRERLAGRAAGVRAYRGPPSIVPPPFGSG